ncbi:hypothetical protein L3556_00110 [Candidatus Synechococcus calcipolaris G9]|uniref:Bestrophin n=1 Tax=Candidatus Synechococcus calcipolaris G9 TaxID=1497997 RepID=A0ABT6ETU3_9SYNE|nr:bestrophin family ion channel [Candidatus Synechococcus calcipolaris]MDG2989339.1 hypothetical protein [Candidatus Synechococcus calcipolaris G9]
MERPRWLYLALQYRGSVIPAILPQVIFCGLFGVLVSAIHLHVVSVSWPVLGSIIPSVVLGLLLVLRTNTGYEHFWEGRKLWGQLINTSRSLTRLIWVAIEEEEDGDHQRKIDTVRLVVAYAIATKQHLRNESLDELATLISPIQYNELVTVQNPPLRIAYWIENYLHSEYRKGHLPLYQLTYMDELLVFLVDYLGGCERIVKTPIPLAYAIHLRQLLLLYCLLLPFQMVHDLAWYTGPVVSLIAFTLFGVEEIGLEIENPFGQDANDLPLDSICVTIQQNVEDLIHTKPSPVHQDHCSIPVPRHGNP